jgi:hypothetical protein
MSFFWFSNHGAFSNNLVNGDVKINSF